MPWKVSDVMEQRFRLVERWKHSGEGIAELARRFAISRKTAYKWLERYELGGLEGLQDRSRRPLVQAGRTPPALEQWVVDLRHTHPSWGPRKLRAWLERRMPELSWPAESTLGLILERHGLSGRRKKRRRATPSTQPLAHAVAANQVWAIDFKGWFACGDGRRCDPLTVSDAATRYLLCCQAVPVCDTQTVQSQLTEVFRRYNTVDLDDKKQALNKVEAMDTKTLELFPRVDLESKQSALKKVEELEEDERASKSAAGEQDHPEGKETQD